MQRKQHLYRHIVRVAAASAACLVFATSLLSEPVQEKTYESTALLANVVGMFAGALPNPDNTKAAALAAKEAELNEREQALAAQSPADDSYDLLSLAAFALSALVLLLVSLNFYFDHLHTREQKRGPYQHT